MKRIIIAVAMFMLSHSAPGMVALDDGKLGEIYGQALLVADYIAPTGAAGGPRNFHFYRMGLDVEVALNMNIDKLQLGCGGFNESVRANSCDIDMDYVRFMGRHTGSSTFNPNQPTGAGRAGNPVESNFILHRPYIELAIRQDGLGNREVAGLKVSAEWADGFFGVGRYDPSTGQHSGVNTMSGFLNVYLSGYARFSSTLGSGAGCIGRPTDYPGPCNSGPEFFNIPSQFTTGTRMTELNVPGVELRNLHGASGLLSLLQGNDLFAQMSARLIELHGFEIAQAEDFFIAFQREQIEYPTYSYANNGGRYSQRANAGWWMNVPRVELKDLEPASINLGCPGFACSGLLSAFSYPGINAGYPDMRSRPPVNCYGNRAFC